MYHFCFLPTCTYVPFLLPTHIYLCTPFCVLPIYTNVPLLLPTQMYLCTPSASKQHVPMYPILRPTHLYLCTPSASYPHVPMYPSASYQNAHMYLQKFLNDDEMVRILRSTSRKRQKMNNTKTNLF